MTRFSSMASTLVSPQELDALLADLGDPEPSARKAALTAVGPLMPEAPPRSLVRAIAAALDDPDGEARELAVLALAAAGAPARGALPRLIEALHDPEPRVRRAAAA